MTGVTIFLLGLTLGFLASEASTRFLMWMDVRAQSQADLADDRIAAFIEGGAS